MLNSDRIVNDEVRFELPTSNIEIQKRSQIPTIVQKPFNLRARLTLFATEILKVCRMIPSLPECDGIRRQLANSATSIGANFEEADGALTRKDFINKVAISRKEAKETRYWLQVIGNTYISHSEISDHIDESEAIIRILSTILKNSGQKERK